MVFRLVAEEAMTIKYIRNMDILLMDTSLIGNNFISKNGRFLYKKGRGWVSDMGRKLKLEPGDVVQTSLEIE